MQCKVKVRSFTDHIAPAAPPPKVLFPAGVKFHQNAVKFITLFNTVVAIVVTFWKQDNNIVWGSTGITKQNAALILNLQSGCLLTGAKEPAGNKNHGISQRHKTKLEIKIKLALLVCNSFASFRLLWHIFP